MLQRVFDKIPAISTIAIQVVLTISVMVSIYMVFALMDYQGDIDQFVGMIIFQPLLAVILSVLTVVFCFVLGLPIRLIKNINSWWRNHFYIAFILALVGLILLCLSLMPSFTQQTTVTVGEGNKIDRTIPNGKLAISGWFITAFSTLHLYPPKWLAEQLKEKVNKFFGAMDR